MCSSNNKGFPLKLRTQFIGYLVQAFRIVFCIVFGFSFFGGGVNTETHSRRFQAHRIGEIIQHRRLVHDESHTPLNVSYVHGPSTVPQLSLTIGQSLLTTVNKWPDREAVVFLQDGIRKSFSQFQHEVDHLAAGLLALGLQNGDRLGIWGPNNYEWILCQFATAKAGIIMVSLNPAYEINELAFALRKVQCNALVCPTRFKSQRFCDMLRELCPELNNAVSGSIRSTRLPDLRKVIVTDSKETGMLHLDDVMQAAESQHHRQLNILQRILHPEDPINIQFTSGTTGNPKGVTLSHQNIVNNAYFIGLRMGYSFRTQVRVCVPVPMYHCFGSVLGGMCMAVHGITLVFPSSAYDTQANLEAIQKEKCTVIYGTPTMNFEPGIIGGSSCPPEIIRRVISDMKVKQITVAYGTTENSPITFLGFPMDRMELKTDSVGYIMDHTEAKVVEPLSGQLLPLGQPGELLIRGYCVMQGYWDEPERTRESISEDGWYKTGDIASLNQYGFCRIEGRIKDMINRGGEKIFPAEVEQFLHRHPKVKNVQVVGVKDDRLGEQVCACIKVAEGHDCTVEEIKAYCKDQISYFKIPHYVMFVEKYPLTASGKVQKNKLRAEMENILRL
ncbi:medium-chain acyl-CoA ligase ACSF2, mitochondrial-like isoform X2 [Tachysurus fulvidraco]|uniref:medium-chain acyl-CoA ligase ACSF2, mitochondrial-like isoform X2 n=1 Tax=Tachysurus fulvidraco TaxID=1234273 RepID=UPI001FEE6ECE|nr:medium-chain acyl-CoA ligase ACSF2, mitochondrial-like isoform X2 [Tachysurus fulvidraco]